MRKYNWKQILITLGFIWIMIINISTSDIASQSSNSLSLEEVSQITSSQDSFTQCEKIGNILYALSVTGGLKSYDITNIENPILLDSIVDTYYSHQFDFSNDLCCVADWLYGIKIYNISNPSNIVKLVEYYPEIDARVSGLCVKDNLLVANEAVTSISNTKIVFLNITNPSLPTVITIINDGVSFFQRFLIEGDYCFAASYNNGIKVYDISDLSDITEVYHYTGLFAPTDIMKSDDIMYVNDFNYFRIVNVSNLANFNIIGGYHTTKNIDSFSVYNSLAFVCEQEACLSIIDITNLSLPEKIGQFDVEFIYHCFSEEQYLYLSLGDNGIKILSYQLISTSNNSSIFANVFEFLTISGITILSMSIYLKIKISKKV
ncbi:MAG: LVIVD repeat-containing protein [Candidatus Thorarchaeota archaeon]